MEFRHPKYYAALRAERRKHQASSAKQQAPSVKHQAHKKNPGKIQAPSNKPQAPSPGRLDPRYKHHETFENDSGTLDRGPRLDRKSVV